MKRICKATVDINGIIIGNKGDLLVITDAVPNINETYRDVEGYCDIENVNTGKVYNATWLDIDYSILESV